jgi:SAM-dependent methyltransferase
VDAWAGDLEHDTAQYLRACNRLNRFRTRNAIIRARFDEALSLFPDQSLDFIYVDGYAHTGEEGGQTFEDWWPKLKPGGIFAGDDYDPDRWPQVTTSVDFFLETHGLDAYVIPFTEEGSIWSEFPTWFTRKPL